MQTKGSSRSGPTIRTSCRSARCTMTACSAHEDAELDRIGDVFSGLPIWRPQVGRTARALKAELAALVRDDIASRTALDRRCGAERRLAGARYADPGQYWRVAYFGVAADDINYRRFFNINDLAGLRMELPEVFRHAHARIIPLIEDGTLDGLRIDHVDGLLDPKGYFDDLRAAAPRPFYLVVEKILAAHETFARTGRSRNDRLRIHQPGARRADQPGGEESFTEIYRSFTGITTPFSRLSVNARSGSWRTRWRANSTCSAATPRASRARTR